MPKVILTLKRAESEMRVEIDDLEIAIRTMYYQRTLAPFVTLHHDDTGEIIWSTEHGEDTHRVEYVDEALGCLARFSR